uniref:(northern house mosquito) hypothetical protein n=1 Tax=Culex pipiens TaxID=7175 RepID=A0A8D8C612_CULPI
MLRRKSAQATVATEKCTLLATHDKVMTSSTTIKTRIFRRRSVSIHQVVQGHRRSGRLAGLTIMVSLGSLGVTSGWTSLLLLWSRCRSALLVPVVLVLRWTCRLTYGIDGFPS